MLGQDSAIETELVLIGGGHSHALVLKMWKMGPLPGVRLTLVSNVTYTPYSGMLPGFISGAYSYDEVHVDLRRLCQFAGARFIHGGVQNLDLENKYLFIEGHSPVHFDVLSINTGSTPRMIDVPGAQKYAAPIKPVPEFLEVFDRLLKEHDAKKPKKIGIVGGGAGGTELSLCLHERFQGNVDIFLVHRNREILDTHTAKVRTLMTEAVRERGIKLILNAAVSEVNDGSLRCNTGEELAFDYLFWVTQAKAAEWPGRAGLSTIDGGFIDVLPTLQSTSHPYVFAAGDVATVKGQARPKSGVFAVRMAKPLFENLRRFIQGKALRTYRPQKNFLSLIGTADKKAVASRGSWAWRSSCLWKLKDWIDRKFMAQVGDFKGDPRMKEAGVAIRCKGCAAKVGGAALSRVLKGLELDSLPTNGVSVGLSEADDAAIFQVPKGASVVQTVDLISAIVDDPYTFGKIGVFHAVSDVIAMGAEPLHALAIAILPHAVPRVMEDSLFQLMSGVRDGLQEAGMGLIGGHSAEGQEMALGLTCNGTVQEGAIWKKNTLREGDCLVLSKGIGTGIIFAAHMALKAEGRAVDAALKSMLQCQTGLLPALRKLDMHACTDVTGFGLYGHLREMLKGTHYSACLWMDELPLIEGVNELNMQGIRSTLFPSNLERAEESEEVLSLRHRHMPLLFDPQTSGPLLMAVPESQVEVLMGILHDEGFANAACIGKVLGGVNEKKSRSFVVFGDSYC